MEPWAEHHIFKSGDRISATLLNTGEHISGTIVISQHGRLFIETETGREVIHPFFDNVRILKE